MSGLTPSQEQYFKTMEKLDPSDDMRRIIEDAKADLRESNGEVVRGVSRLRGFQPE